MINKPEEKRRQWRQHIQNWRHSGQSQKAYCEAHHLKPNQFWYWQRQFNGATPADTHSSNSSAEVSSGFVPVQMDTPPRTTGLCLELPNGIRLHGLAHTSPELLQNIIQAVS